MTTDKQIKWSEEALNFFDSSIDNSIDLTFIVCHECLSQSGEGFEELVNAINQQKK